jgi:hypothetical protein
MTLARLPVTDARRQRIWDDRLWKREFQRARLLNVQHLHCPCIVCRGQRRLLVKMVREHLIRNGRDSKMRVWRGPGNQDSSDEEWEEEFWNPAAPKHIDMDAQVDTQGMLQGAFQQADTDYPMEDKVRDKALMEFTTADTVSEECRNSSSDAEVEATDYGGDEPDVEEQNHEGAEDSNFDPHALEDAMTPLYDGAKCSKLAATILLMNLCTVHGISNSFAEELFTILNVHILPEKNCLPKNHYAAKSLTKKLGLAYNTIHACERRCVLFRGTIADADKCPKCDQPRYRDFEHKKFPVKVLRHFPIIPRLQRMFRSPSIAKLMLWHSENTSSAAGGDNLMRHPCDSKAWHHFHRNVDPTFGTDPRNAHFALAADGVNPFKQTWSTWSTWPMILLNYNLPPWLSTKKFFMFLALLILGKELVTSEVFDVYLEPVVEQLLELWAGVPTYDCTKEVGSQAFTLRAVLMWTIHDFPGYGTVGGFPH